jgi:hypothetical protein
MSIATGYVLRLSRERLAALAAQLENANRYVQPVAEFKSKSPFLCFVVGRDGAVHYVAKATRGSFAGTALRKLILTSIEPVTARPSLLEIASRAPAPFRTLLGKRIRKGGLLTGKQFDALMRVISATESELRGLAHSYPFLIAKGLGRLSSATREGLAYQRDAVGLALMLGGMDRTPLLEWRLSDHQTPKSFLDGLPYARLREDAMIVNDLWTVPGFQAIQHHLEGAVDFEDGRGARLTVVLANRLPLEELTGVDLIYVNSTFRSFVMVQYKAMEHESGNAVFRLPNAQLEKELERMEELLDALGNHDDATDADDFRLHLNPFFLKLCPRVIFNPDQVDLMKGMCIPLEKWKLLVKSSQVSGPRGGTLVTYRNVKRYFDNTQFVALVRNAWVGTRSADSALLESVIKETLQEGRAAVLAMRRQPPAAPF